MHGDDGIAGVVLAAEHLAHLHLAEELLDLEHLRLGLGPAFLVALGGHLEEHLGVGEPTGQVLPRIERGLEQRALLQELLRALGIVPEIRRRALLGELAGAPLEHGDVKDASRAYRYASRAGSAFRESHRPRACESFLGCGPGMIQPAYNNMSAAASTAPCAKTSP